MAHPPPAYQPRRGVDDFNGNVHALRNNDNPNGVNICRPIFHSSFFIFHLITVTPTGLWHGIGHLLVIGRRTAVRLYKGHV